MRYLFLFLALLGGLRPGGARAQQVLCQRGLGTYQATLPYSLVRTSGQLTATAPDSCLLLVNQALGTEVSEPQTRSRLVWVNNTNCDTARFASLPTGRTSELEPTALMRRRRGDLLVANTRARQTAALTDSNHVELRSYSRRGTLRWTRSYPATSQVDRVYAIVEAPDQGAYLTVGLNLTSASGQLWRVDSMGRLLWRRFYCKGATRVFHYAFSYLYYRPAYTVRGTLLLGGQYSTQSQPTLRGLLVEINQRGDSLTSRELRPADPTRYLSMLGLRPLHDGGFLVTATLDTTLNGSSTLLKLPYLLRLDADLNVQWRRGYKAALGNHLLDLTQGGYELADGSLLVFYQGYANTAAAVVRWLRLSATGELLATDTFQPGQPTRAGIDQWLTPLAADSSFMLAGNRLLYNGLYLTHFRLPGLRRVLAEPGIPAVQVLAARAPLAAFPTPAFPNPAREAVTVPLPAGTGAGRLRLLDLTGRLVREQATAAGAAQVALPLGGVAQGVYLLQFERAGQPPATQRLAVGP